MVATNGEQSISLGLPVPPHTAHAISVSLPTWRDNVGYEEGEKRVIDAMVSGYPRFFVHLSIRKLARICEQKFGAPGENGMLFPTKGIAEKCRAFMLDRSPEKIPVRLVQFLICPEDKGRNNVNQGGCSCNARPVASPSCAELHIVLFPSTSFSLAKQFWQHSGTGISSRLAEYCLSLLPDEAEPSRTPPSPLSRFPSKNKHYSVNGSSASRRSFDGKVRFSQFTNRCTDEVISKDQNVYLEERYGRNLTISFAPSAKRALRRRIAGVLACDSSEDCPDGPLVGKEDTKVGPSSRGVSAVTENDVYLFPTGMSAIWNAHQLALATRSAAKSVCFGFPYTDTLKILEKWGPGCHFLGHGLDSDIDILEKIIESELSSPGRDPTTPPILGLFTEFPSNPLLRSADLPRLRALADKHDFLIIIDETLGNFVNVQVLPYADVVVSSLSKIFSGESNVMGGSMVLNPKGRHYKALKTHLDSSYEDVYFNEDAIYMERNSRNFEQRIKIIDANAAAVCSFLHSRSLVGSGAVSSTVSPTPVIKEVFYPKWQTRSQYEHCRIPGGGFGGLFSITFTSSCASRAFFDTLPCYKGPSLGTNFTLACPYTILAHYLELEWAAGYGVEETLVRVSVGMEETGALLKSFEEALKAAEEAAGG